MSHDNYQKWDLPGGRIDEGEDFEVAFKREIEEEVGLKKFTDLGLADYVYCWKKMPEMIKKGFELYEIIKK